MSELAAKRVLFALAHPDDESFGSGGLIAHLVYQHKAEVNYVCATKGNRGTIPPEILEKYKSAEAVRNHELDCASLILGFNKVYKFDYDDSGMMGTPPNDNPKCLWQADEDAVVDRLVEIIREDKPQIVITFDPYGAYGHPDHIFMHKATTRAFFLAGKSDYRPDLGAKYQPQKLYYTVIPERVLRIYVWLNRVQGKDPRRLGVNKDLDLIRVLERSPQPHAIVNVRRWMKHWDAASRCHASQNSLLSLLPFWVRYLVTAEQKLHRHHPPVKPGERIERDIFAKVDLRK